MTEDTSFNINAGILNRSAIVYTRRKINEPRTIPTALTKIPPRPRIVPPISRDASAIVTIPWPILISTDFCDWDKRHPESAVNAFATQRPITVVNTGLIEDDFTISELFPVALIARPSLVFRKNTRNMITRITAIAAIIISSLPFSGVPESASFIIVNTVVVRFILIKDEPPMTAMFTEYNAVFTMIPASRLSTPSFVCRIAVTNPDIIPAAIAATIDRKGCPLTATTAPTAAPKVKQPSVERSQTFSIE